MALVKARAVTGGGGGEDELHARHDRVAVDGLVVIIHRVARTRGTDVARRPHFDHLVRRTRDHRLAILQHVVDHRVPAADRRDETQAAVGAVVVAEVIDVPGADRAVVGPPIQKGVATLVTRRVDLAIEGRAAIEEVGTIGSVRDLGAMAEERQLDAATRVHRVHPIPGLGQKGEVAAEAAVRGVDQEPRRISRKIVEAGLVDGAHRHEAVLDRGVEGRARRQAELGRRLGQSQRGEIDAAEGAGAARGLEDVGRGSPGDGGRRSLQAHEGLLVLTRDPPGEGAIGDLIGEAVGEVDGGQGDLVGGVGRRLAQALGRLGAHDRRTVGERRRKEGGEPPGVGPER